ncbi:hypothetical protein B0H63DRAFT_544782 [Podospora didyma]|uniref:NACHT-NTPase and P-loop NTPases N-terminal domain-containing protein n=1 Tax=Podospora didyma TaxID=330526 RepID=A0AAE0NR47_9PEZI|nr:hypothetical protein B0H63DRAFT_544782 [Podospora didyma]
MAEAAVGLVGLVSSVVTFVDVSAKIISLIRECSDPAGSGLIRDIETQLPLLAKIFEDIKQDAQAQNLSSVAAAPLQQAIDGCLRQANIIESLIARMVVDSKASKMKRTLGVMRRIAGDKKLNDAWRILESYKTTVILHVSWSKQPPTPPPNTPSASSRLLFNIPKAGVANFIGREKILQKLTTLLLSANGTAFQADRAAVLHGMGGQGKTQIAVEFCRRTNSQAVFSSIFWIDSSSIESMVRDYESLAAKMATGKTQFPDSQAAVEYAKRHISSSASPWLLVFDNLDVPAVFEKIRDYLPDISSGAVLYVSRHTDTSRLGTPILVEGLDPSDSVELLLTQSRSVRNDPNVEAATEIASELGHLPLAIDQAAAYIYSRRVELHDFMDHYSKHKTDILKRTPRLWEYQKTFGSSNTTATTVFTTWEMSFELLAQEPNGPQIAHLLTLGAFFHNQCLHRDLFRESLSHSPQPWTDCMGTGGEWDEYKFQDLLANMLSLSLIQSLDLSNGDVCFTIHPLVQEWLQYRLSEAESCSYACEAVVTLARTVDPEHLSRLPLNMKQRLVANTDACLANADKILTNAASPEFQELRPLLGVLAAVYEECIRFSSAEHLHQLAYRTAQSAGDDIEGESSAAFNLAGVYLCLGRYDKARALYRQATKERETRLGLEHQQTLRAKYGCAIAESYLKRYDQAKALLEDVLRIQTLFLPELRRDIVNTLSELANVYRLSKHLEEARSLYEMAVVERVKHLGHEHPESLASLEGLAIVYRNQKRLDEATILYQHIADGLKSMFGLEHPRTLRTMVNYAIALVHQSKYAEAVQLLEKAAEGFESLLGAAHPDTAWSKVHLEDARLIRDNVYNQMLLHYGLQMAMSVLYRDVPAPRSDIAARERALMPKPVETVPLSWSAVNSMFDDSGARRIELAAANHGAHRDLTATRRMGEVPKCPNPELASKLGYTYGEFADTMQKLFGITQCILDGEGQSALHRAAYVGDTPLLRILLSRPDAKPDQPAPYSLETPLVRAIIGNQEEAVALLLKQPGVDLNSRDSSSRTPLIHAAWKNNPRIVRQLLDTNAISVNLSGEHSEYSGCHDTALAWAANNGNEEIVCLLLDAGARDNLPIKKSALLSAVERGHEAIAMLLLERASSDVTFTTASGYTVLHDVRSAELCKTLLDRGGRKVIDAVNKVGQTPLLRAQGGVAKVLLDHGADPSIRTKMGETPLLRAVRMWQHDKIGFLLATRTAETDIPDEKGETPLTVAFRRGDQKSVTLLLEAGAAVDYDDLGALDFGQGNVTKKTKEEMLQFVRDFRSDGQVEAVVSSI